MRIRGFQSHVDSYFKLGPGLTVITGPSDAGKTALIRVLRWVVFGEPGGEAFINENVGEASVTIYLENGLTISKTRKKGKTSYQLQEGPEKLPLRWEKAEVPEEIKQALGLYKQSFGDFETALNFAYQLEAPFLISEPASAGAKVLGVLAGTEVVDLAIKAVSKDTYQARQERLQAEKDIERAEAALVDFQDLDKLKEQLTACEFLLEQVEQAVAKGAKLCALKQAYEVTSLNLQRYIEELDRLAIVPQLEQDLEDIEKAQQRYQRILGLYNQLDNLSQRVDELNNQLALYIGLDEASTALDFVSVSNSRYSTLISLSISYKKYSEEVNKAEDILIATKGLEVAADALEMTESRSQKISRLKALADKCCDLNKQIWRCRDALELTAGVKEAADLLTQTLNKEQKIQSLRQFQNTYNVKFLTLRQAEDKAAQVVKELKQYETELADLWTGLKVCPLCEQPITGGIC